MGMKTNEVTVTFDTNVFPAADLIQKAENHGYRVSVISVTERESQSCSFDAEMKSLKTVPETFVLNESILNSNAQLSEEQLPGRLELALKILSNGSFPPLDSRNILTKGQKRMLRDAMILAAHSREGHDILVTNDAKGFINNGRREKIEKVFKTKILNVIEFENQLERQSIAHHSMNQSPISE